MLVALTKTEFPNKAKQLLKTYVASEDIVTLSSDRVVIDYSLDNNNKLVVKDDINNLLDASYSINYAILVYDYDSEVINKICLSCINQGITVYPIKLGG